MTPSPLQRADVDRERDRRFGLRVLITLDGGRSFPVDIHNTSKINIMGLLMAGAAAKFRDRNNITHVLSAADIASLAAQATRSHSQPAGCRVWRSVQTAKAGEATG